jgi:gliding motility-associated lipoprotein GldH
MNSIFKIAFVSIILCLGACALRHNDYSEFKDIDSEGWQYGDTLTFKPTITDSLADGKLMLAVRHSNAYQYANLWLEISYPMADTIIADTINVKLADVYGRWYGKGLGVSFQKSDTLSRNFKLHRDTPIKLRHIMRVDTLSAIEQVGITFIANEQ